MTYNHGDYVTVYDRNGHLQCKGRITGVNHVNPQFYDVRPEKEFGTANFFQIPAARIHKAYVPVDESPKNIDDKL